MVSKLAFNILIEEFKVSNIQYSTLVWLLSTGITQLIYFHFINPGVHFLAVLNGMQLEILEPLY